MKRPLGAQISHMLKARGVDTIFGIPGVHNVEMYRGIEEAGITHVLARHEQGAGFMADGYARATGKVGVAYVITGPGLCNIMTPMGQAYSDSVPMLVISSCLDEVAASKGQLHQMKDQRAAAETVCDWSEEAKTAEAAYTLIDRALEEFFTQRPRPKHIQVPIELLGEPVDPAPPTAFAQYYGQGSWNLADLAKDLHQAKKPLFVFGGGCANEDIGNSRFSSALPDEMYIRDLVKRTKAAAFTTYAGRGALAPDDPYSLGSNLSKPESAAVFAEADLIICIGTELAEVDLWRPQLGHTCKMVRVDIDPQTAFDGRGADEVIIGRASAVVFDLLAALPADGTSDWDPRKIADLRKMWRAQTDANKPGIVRICDALKDCVGPASIYSDMTQFAYVAKDVWDMEFMNMWHHPYGFGTLGYALPAAIGGKIGAGDAPVIAIAGDYGFQYTVQELGVAVELGLSLPIILWDNGKLKEIEDCMVNSQIAPNAVVARNPDFCKLAQAWGANSAKPTSLSALQDAVKAALVAEGPTLIHVTPDIAD